MDGRIVTAQCRWKHSHSPGWWMEGLLLSIVDGRKLRYFPLWKYRHTIQRKSPESDGISQEVIKCGKPELLEPFHELLCLCWEEGAVPKTCATQPSSPYTRTRVTAVIAAITRAFHCWAPSRKTLAACIYAESQWGFRAGRSTIDMIFTVR